MSQAFAALAMNTLLFQGPDQALHHAVFLGLCNRLLTETFADNISLFGPDMDLARVAAAAEAAQVADDIAGMPMQYLSLVGDMGSTLSGGQKQGVLLARAIHRQPHLLLLDEGTANSDELAEQAIADLLEGRPTARIVFAHRPDLVERACRVLVEHEGRVHQAR
jgi:ATP-binding cassette, subfamily B, bacterial CvaB/MchF/RaxB